MTLSRRRFLTISAAASVALPAQAQATEPAIWHGRALGADVSLRVEGLAPAASARLWRRVARVLEEVEARFSLFRRSELVRLNETGILAHPSADMRALIALSGQLNTATGGAFDPSVQVIWQALSEARDPSKARQLVGWQKVEIDADRIRLAPGAALTFNGIAQGFAADQIAALMRQEGLGNVLIDAGEVAALGHGAGGHPWRAGIAGPDGALLAERPLANRALATSSPAATRVGPDRAAHILHPDGRAPLWQTVSVSAPTAALADGLSTAFCLMKDHEIMQALAAFPGTRLEYLG
ncbi:FAD:protein FMN transferase [Rhodalgimonas zhirmunskyi]|uniref:FAD:protein FMN transferase n=1 Tax=Rhodalgimonas zhirmunskyi TaxID=2964767 RepID=A0AAJ1UFG4_9RHOB|nr:FAD:protein FMN transferase [Rhodoalgimonas zhirmunskyi]MDQ2095127.1 FAD:protein FMN transferase [Rhodoalgimonas zhirmunskyi]